MAYLVEPCLIVEPDSVDDQRIAVLVLACRVSPPLRVRIVGMFAVEPHDAEIWPQLMKDVYRFGRLDEPRFDRPQVDVGNSRRFAVKDLRVCRFYEIGLRPR